jgi:uncharacterized RDD family membrane protein YckC
MASVVCPNCNATIPPHEVAAGWCEACGKKIPAYALGSFAPAPFARSATDYAPPRPDRSYYGYGPRRSLASRVSRLGAALLDTIFMVVAYAPGFALLIMAEQPRDYESKQALTMLGLGLWLAGMAILVVIQLTLLCTSGQTLGKRLAGVRIVNYADEANPGFVGAVLMRSILPGLLGSCVPFFSLIDILFIFGEERRCVHDLMAGTKVVEA